MWGCSIGGVSVSRIVEATLDVWPLVDSTTDYAVGVSVVCVACGRIVPYWSAAFGIHRLFGDS